MSQTKAQLVQPVGILTGDGINVSGVITATTFEGDITASTGFTTNATNTNLKVTGVGTFAGAVTAASFSGDGSGLTGVANTAFINAEQLTVVGVVTAATGDIGNLNITKSAAGAGATVGSYTGVTTYYGDGSALTGVGESIAPWHYNPDVNDVDTGATATEIGIGITFNKKVVAGSGTATLKIVNAGVAGTTIQSWGVSSCTFNVTEFSLGSLVSNLSINQTYQVDIPATFIDDSAGSSYVGTAYTFTVSDSLKQLWVAGYNNYGTLGQNNITQYSSPVQIPGSNWSFVNGTSFQGSSGNAVAFKTDGTLWVWGGGNYGGMGLNNEVHISSPTQIPGTTWGTGVTCNENTTYAIKTDGTFWVLGGRNNVGQLGVNDKVDRSSPVQIPGTTWWADDTHYTLTGGTLSVGTIKSDGTLWAWGYNANGMLGLNSTTYQSSPCQIPGTTWRSIAGTGNSRIATKTDGTLWTWGYNNDGALGHSNQTNYSSPKQVPGTTWSKHIAMDRKTTFAIRTDGTLWSWGDAKYGMLGTNNPDGDHQSSPKQIPGTTWATISSTGNQVAATKTDGTLWTWGAGGGGLMQSSNVSHSSPTQVGSETYYADARVYPGGVAAMVTDTTP